MESRVPIGLRPSLTSYGNGLNDWHAHLWQKPTHKLLNSFAQVTFGLVMDDLGSKGLGFES